MQNYMRLDLPLHWSFGRSAALVDADLVAAHAQRYGRDRPMKAQTVKALSSMTVARGYTHGEAAAAIEALRRAMLKLQPGCRGYRFIEAVIAENSRHLEQSIRSQMAEQHKARKGWQFRKCGKGKCHCMNGGALHGPYRYGRRRTDRPRSPGKKARVYSSVYQGKR